MWTIHIKCGNIVMRREFVETKVFRQTWKSAGYDEGDLRELQMALLENPTAGTGISGGMKNIDIRSVMVERVAAPE